MARMNLESTTPRASVSGSGPAKAASKAASKANGVFSSQTMFWVVLIGLISFAALVILTTYADELSHKNGDQPHALANSAIGYAGIVEILNEVSSESTFISRGDDDKWRRGLNIYTPSNRHPLSEDMPLEDIVPTLIILPKWLTRPLPQRLNWVEEYGVLDDMSYTIPVWDDLYEVTTDHSETPYAPVLQISDALTLPNGDVTIGNRLALSGLGNLKLEAPITSVQSISGDHITPLLTDQNGRTLLGRIDDTLIYILADPDLMNTHGVAYADRAHASIQLVHALKNEGAVFFDVTLYGMARSRNILKLAFEPPFSAATLAALLTAGLLAWRAATRFGPVRREERAYALGKQALADNSAALIRMARREHRFAAGYAELTRRAAARIIGAPRNLTGEPLNQFLDRKTLQSPKSGETTDNIASLMTEANRADNRESLMKIARKLYNWRQEISRERH